MSGDKWTMFKNYMHNDLGISKDDIRAWVEEAVKAEATKIVNQTFKKFSVEDLTTQIIKQTMRSSWGTAMNKDIREAVALTLAKSLRISVEED